MLSLKLYGPGDIRLVETAVPDINDDELLLKTMQLQSAERISGCGRMAIRAWIRIILDIRA